jgi:hypothetical protein
MTNRKKICKRNIIVVDDGIKFEGRLEAVKV